MRKNELSIGNLVYYKDKLIKITELLEEGIKGFDINSKNPGCVKYSEIDPVRLTIPVIKDLLGFEKRSVFISSEFLDDWILELFDSRGKCYLITLCESGDNYIVCIDGEHELSISRGVISYVHSLQNFIESILNCSLI